MNGNPPNLTLLPGGGKTAAAVGPQVRSPDVPPGVDLSESEREFWDYLCMALREANLEHQTSGGLLALTTKQWSGWCSAEQELQAVKDANGGSYMTTTPNGFQQPHQAFYIARDMRAELLKYLDKCGMTIEAYATVRSKLGGSGQLDLQFGALVDHASAERKSYSRR